MARPEAIPSSAMKVTSINQETCRLDFSLKVEAPEYPELSPGIELS
jgi:hypothetical protein